MPTIVADPPEDPSAFVDLIGADYFPPDQRFPLLDLPRELRDMVYERMLVRKKIDIAPGYCWKDKARGIQRDWYYLTVHERRRSTYKRTLTRGMPYASYEERKWGSRRNHNCPNLNIFLASRQVYDESSCIYYKQNVFCFDVISYTLEVLSVSACHAFLLDRPLRSLQRLRSIELSIDIPNSSRPAAYFLDGDVFVLLVNSMRNDSSLDHLSLHIGGWPPDMRSIPWNWEGDEDEVGDHPRKWIGALALLNTLKSLSITLYAAWNEDYGRLVTCAAFLRSRMLINGATLGTKNIHAYHRHGVSAYKQINRKPTEIYLRSGDRNCVVQCYDDEHGKSLLPPKARHSPAFPGIKATRVQQGHDPSAVEKALRDAIDEDPFKPLCAYRIFCDEDEDKGEESDEDSWPGCLDYDLSDGGDDDSLISIDLDDMNLDYVRDDEYFAHFDEHEQEFKPCTTR